MVVRPQLRWEEMVKRDARNLLNVSNWRTMARDECKRRIEEAMVWKRVEESKEEERLRWRKFLEEAKAHSRLSSL